MAFARSAAKNGATVAEPEAIFGWRGRLAKSGNLRTATVMKANDSEEGAQVAFTLDSITVGSDMDWNPTTGPIVLPAEVSP